MSTILDALKRSERERTLVRGTGFGDAARQLPPDNEWLRWLLGGIVLVAVSVLVAVFVLRENAPIVDATGVATPEVATARPAAVVPVSNESRSASVPVTVPALTSKSLPALQEAVVAAPPPVVLLPSDGEARLLSAMSPEFQRDVPPMTVNIHVYAPEESQRILYINNRQYYRGDELPGGVLVEEVVPDGVVLQFHGQRFRLPRPS